MMSTRRAVRLVIGLLSILLLVQGQTDRANADQITSLPGTIFQVAFKQYAGYLNSDESNLHYWYLESQINPVNDSLLLFINGGPGCSSVFGMFEEIGPFRVSADSQTLFENVFAWNKVNNLLVIDSPGTGFSLHDQNHVQSDDFVISALTNALVDFYTVFPNLLNNDLYIGGEGYASVFASNIFYNLLTNGNPNPDKLASGINIKGLLVANGVLSAKHQFNSIIPFQYTHGYASAKQYDDLKSVCGTNQSTLNFDFYGSTGDCKTKATQAVTNWISDLVDSSNILQDCYRHKILLQTAADLFGLQLSVNNYNSTDPFVSYPCHANSVTEAYLNRPDVKAALHVSSHFNQSFHSCKALNYLTKTNDISILIGSIIQNNNYANKNGKIMVYNGDLDIMSNFIGAQRFGQQVAAGANLTIFNTTLSSGDVLLEDRIWRHNYDSGSFQWMDGGVLTKYTKNFHIASVRGAGHFAPQIRPSQSLQLYRDFVLDLFFNNCLSRVNKQAAPLLPIYQQQADTIARKEADRIRDLPGLTYAINFNQYSGYLNASATHKYHYWFVESQTDPANAPVLLWLNGGPGSSSVWGMLTENGPFRPNRDGQTLYENIFSWNRFANVLYLESPHQVGFSYSTVDNDIVYGDDLTASDNLNSIQDFFTNIFPEYQKNPFYITGESYGGVYIPTLSRHLIERISSGHISLNFKGIAIGNAELTTKFQVNSAIFQLYTYGLVGEVEYNNLVAGCCKNYTDPTECDFYTPYIYFDNLGNYKPVDGAEEYCSKPILGIVNDQVWNTENDPYNIYQDCYKVSPGSSSSSKSVLKTLAFRDNAALLNLESSDPFGGFPCWNTDAVNIYLNRADVRSALHIPSFVQQWQSFNQTINEQLYNRSYFELDEVLRSIISSYYYKNSDMSILIYNGDVDMVCNHLGDQWLIEKLASDAKLTTVTNRTVWNFVYPATNNWPMFAGYVKVFSSNLNLLTVKGSGHLVPQDRPGPALQMIYNFVQGNSFNVTLPFDVTAKPLLPSYTDMSDCPATIYPDAKPLPSLPPLPPLPPGVTYPPARAEAEETEHIRRKRDTAAPTGYLNTNATYPTNLTDAAFNDLILSLPGLTWNISYRMFSGYLTPPEFPQNHLFYWFVESQNDPVNDPVVLWLNGGPGCSSLGGFFTELGPFHPNDDNGQTLYENVFSWNKKANVIFLEAPAKVGFSYTDDTSYYWNDDTTAGNNTYAIKAFFEKNFPQYAQNEFYITGESYGGVYCPTLTLGLIDLIDTGNLKLNFKGTAIGNGILSEYLQTNSEIVLQYGRGFNGVDEWNNLKQACNLTNSNPLDFDYSNAPYRSACDNAANAVQDQFYDYSDDPYNMYQDCYLYSQNGNWINPSSKNAQILKKPTTKREKATYALMNRRKNRVFASAKFSDSNSKNWYGSTDAFRGLNCFGGDALVAYLSRADVQSAIHAQRKPIWVDCADELASNHWRYHTQVKYYDMSDTLSKILDSNWYTSNNMRLMFYNGDVDTICQFLGDQWLIEKLVVTRNMTVIQQRSPWYYQEGTYSRTIAGYVKSWNQNVVQLTVKGSGHFVPSDRPAQALQMLTNFLSNQANYSTPSNIDVAPKPLNIQTPVPSPCNTGTADRIIGLPGVPADVQFRQYSGFLDGLAGHKLHYWLIESENDPSTDPLLLWLNGGPGSSSLMGLFEENGPFRVSKDGSTLSRNPYSWNKFANVLYLESPVGVGYSYSSDGQAVQYDDNSTAYENYAALKDFFNKYPQYASRDFYTTGESYGGVYLPSLAKLLVLGIKSGDVNINYKGLAIGNGVIDKNSDIDSFFHYQYYHGNIPYTVYKTALDLCCTGDEFKCKFSSHFTVLNNSIPWGNLNDSCYDYIVAQGAKLLMNAFDPYNLYQTCYTLPLNSTIETQKYGETWTGINYESSDPFNGYPCYMDNAMQTYLNLPDVRTALNIPASVGAWQANNNIINAYNQQINSATDNLQTIITNAPVNFKIIHYSGDADTMVNWLGSEIYTSQVLPNNLSLAVVKERSPWIYQVDQIYYPTLAGYQTSYSNDIVVFDVVTVKGSGHFVPLDRPQQALQLIYNFVKRRDYSTPYDLVPPTTTTTTVSPTATPTVPSFPTNPVTGATVPTNPATGATVPQPTTPTQSAMYASDKIFVLFAIFAFFNLI